MDKENNESKREILALVEQYYNENFKERKFIPGETFIHCSGKLFDQEEFKLGVGSILDGWWTEGRFAEQFEKDLCEFLGVKYVKLVNSGSSANLVALAALTSHLLGEKRLKKGDEVITVAAGFPTTVNPIIQLGMVPVFVDVEIGNYNALVKEIKQFDIDNSSYSWYGETFVFRTEIEENINYSEVVLNLITDGYVRVRVNGQPIFASKGTLEYIRHDGRPIPSAFLPIEIDITERLQKQNNDVEIYVTNNTIRRAFGISAELKLGRNGAYVREPLSFDCFTFNGKRVPYELLSWDDIVDSRDFDLPTATGLLAYSIDGITERRFTVPAPGKRNLLVNSVSLSILFLVFLSFLSYVMIRPKFTLSRNESEGIKSQ